MQPTDGATPRRAAVIFIFITVLLDVIALGVVIPVLPALIEHFLDGNTAGASRMIGLFGTMWALMQFIFAPVLGALSDRFGRRPVILLSLVGLGIDYIFMALAPTLGWLFVGRLISGITSASYSTATAYIADITPPEKRAGAFGFMGAAWGLGFVLGPAMGGVLGHYDPRLPFWVASGLTLANALYGVFVLPESLPPDRRAPFRWRAANPIGAIALLTSHRTLLAIGAMMVLYQLSHAVLRSVYVIYAQYRYDWGERAVGLSLAFVGVCGVIVQGGLVRIVVRRIGERAAMLTGLFFGIAGFTMIGFAAHPWLFLSAIPVFALCGFFQPAADGITTQLVGPTEQGRLQGANASILGVTGMIGPVLFTQIFAFVISPGTPVPIPGAPFFVAAAALLGAMVIGVGVSRRK